MHHALMMIDDKVASLGLWLRNALDWYLAAVNDADTKAGGGWSVDD